MLAWLKNRMTAAARPADPFAETRARIVAKEPVSTGNAAIDAFFNLPHNEILDLNKVVHGQMTNDEITDPTLRAILALSDAEIGRARAVAMFWAVRDKIGGFGAPDNRFGALHNLADGRGTWTARELGVMLTTHRDVIGLYDYPKLAEILGNSAECGVDVAGPLAAFLTSAPLFERYPGDLTLAAMQVLADMAGLSLDDIPPMREFAEAQTGVKARQVAIHAACGPLMQHVLDETARYDGTSRAVNPHGTFRDALAARLDKLDASERARFCLDIRQCDIETRDPAWRLTLRQSEAVDPRQIRSVTGNVLDLHRLEGSSLAFTHAQALTYLRLMFLGQHPRRGLARIQASLLRSLVRAFEAPDAGIAAQIRNSKLPQNDKDRLLAKLCPDLAGEGDKACSGSPLQRDMAQHRDRLRANMTRLSGLWITVEGEAGPVWPAFNHQLYPFFSEVRRYVDGIEKAAHMGEDIAAHRAILSDLLQQANENLLKLENGRFTPIPLERIKAGLPEGEEVSIKNIYWTMRNPARDRDVFDASGQPKPGLVVRIESDFLDSVTKSLAAIDAVAPASPLAARLAPLLPKENASKPTQAWKKQARAALDAGMLDEILGILAAYQPDGRQHFGVVAEAVAHGTDDFQPEAFSPLQIKAMIWAAQLASPDKAAPILGDLALRCYKRIPGVGQTNGKLGNAAVYSLSQMPGTLGIKQMYRIRHRVAFAGVKSAIDKLLAKTAQAQGLSRVALDEIAVPDHGLVPGPLRLPIGPGAAVIRADKGRIVLGWEDATGSLRKTVPAALTEADADGVKLARARCKAIQQDITEQKARLERMFRQEVSWSFDDWRQKYRDHGTMAVLARQLLWLAEGGQGAQVVLACEGGCEDVEGNPVDLSDATLRLWHPLDSDPALRDAWRLRLIAEGIVQPFRQVWRETYALTDAERETATYSNRFAGHVLRQHQLMALAHANDWKATHRTGFDTPDDEPTHIRLPDFGLQAEYWTGAAGVDGPTTENGAYLYLVTDRLKFHALDEDARFGRGEEVPLDRVPARVLSEMLRDCDLFTSVASISLDPEWRDQGRDAAHPGAWRREADAYWNWSQTAALTASAETRRQMLEVLLPRMKQAAALSLDDTSLRVQGVLHGYRIHLRSGAVIMDDNQQHICIVPDRGKSLRMTLPFDGDPILSLVLSKALLLIEDDKITDPVILRQMKTGEFG